MITGKCELQISNYISHIITTMLTKLVTGKGIMYENNDDKLYYYCKVVYR